MGRYKKVCTWVSHTQLHGTRSPVDVANYMCRRLKELVRKECQRPLVGTGAATGANLIARDHLPQLINDCKSIGNDDDYYDALLCNFEAFERGLVPGTNTLESLHNYFTRYVATHGMKGLMHLEMELASCALFYNYAVRNSKNVAEDAKSDKEKETARVPVVDRVGNTYYPRCRKTHIFRADHRVDLLRKLFKGRVSSATAWHILYKHVGSYRLPQVTPASLEAKVWVLKNSRKFRLTEKEKKTIDDALTPPTRALWSTV